MSIVTGTIEGTGQQVQITIPTKRIPELPPVVLPYDVDDKLPLFDNSANKTVYTPISDFITYLNSGGAAPVAPVVYGADLEIIISASEAGGYSVTRLPLAGKMYSLERRGVGYLKSSEFLILPSGGFEMVDHNDLLQEGEFFIAHVYNYVASSVGASGSGSFLGMVIISSSTALDSTSFNRLIHIAGGSNKVIVTLPDIIDCPNLIFPFETMINNSNQTKIEARVGQKIYFGNNSYDYLYLGISEYIWLMAGVDGWYVMKASEGILNVGQPLMDYVQRLNTYPAHGNLANRADYPRLWDFLLYNPDLIVTEALWNTVTSTIGEETYIESFYKYRGKFSSGDGSTTFRFPLHDDMGYVALMNGTDPDRSPNTAGTAQGDMIRAHTHSQYGIPAANSGTSGSGAGNGTSKTGVYGGSKTVGKNIGLIPLIRT
ncbi:MAG TPA: hypothetical protein VIL78_16310 [Hanamia sp.]